MKVVFCIMVLFSMVGCTDAEVKQVFTLGKPGDIICYSGGKEIYKGSSTGKIATEQGSDGWFFEEAGTNKLVRVSGDCVIKN